MEAYIFRGHCVGVVDGDTIDVVLDLGFSLTSKHRLRLYGVNTPEKNSKDLQIKGKALEAMEFTAQWVFGKDVMIQTYKSDVFGRYLAKVFIEREELPGTYECLNDMLIAEGLAKSFMTDTDLLK